LQEEGASIELTLVRQQEQQLSASVQASPHNGDRGGIMAAASREE
jgi:hypothetical protein